MTGTTVRPGSTQDVAAVLGLLDDAVRWLVREGRTGQWGTSPFSSTPARRHQIETMVSDGVLLIAEVDGVPVGASVLARHPTTYVDPAPVPELYLHLLVTSPSRRGTGIGQTLVDDARSLARSAGVSQLRVDCYAGDDGALVHAYERLGFTRSAAITVQRPGHPPWPGQVLVQGLPAESVAHST